MTGNPAAAHPNLVDEPGVSYALQLAFVASLCSALAISAFTFFLGWPVIPELSLVAAASCLLAFVLTRSGWIRPGILACLAGIAYSVLHAAAMSDGMQSIGFVIIPLLIVAGALLLERVKFLLFTATTILATLGMLMIRYSVLRVKQYNTGDLGDFFIFGVTCAIAALLGRALSVQIQDGFRQVRASESRYRRIFENIQDVYYEMGMDGALLELSPAGAALFGVPREGMIGRPLAQFCVNRAEFDALLGAIRTDGRVSNRELVMRGTGDALVHVLVNASLQTGPEVGEERMIGSIRDITGRTRALEALRESEARLRLALEATGAGTLDFYPQTKKLIWSDITKRHFGVSPQVEVDHAMFLRAVHPDDRELILQAAASVSLPCSGGELATEYRAIGIEDGQERWIAVRGRMQFDSEKRPVRLIGTTLDISGRKRLEEELRRRVEELQKVMDVAPVALFVAHDSECSKVTANRMANAMLEVPEGANSPSAPGGPTPPCSFYRDGIQVPVHELPLQTAARGVEVRDTELEAWLPSGRRRLLWGNASPLRDAAGRVRGAIAAVQDVTGIRQQTDALLNESEHRFRSAADAAPIIMWFGDTEKRITFVNQQFIRFTGLPVDQLLGHGWAQVLHPDDLDASRAVYYASVDSRTSYQLEYRARRADGEYRHMLGTTSPRYVGHEYAGQIGSVIDITDLKHRQEQDFARQKLESVGVLAGGIAHDFNNLMGAVLAQADLALVELAAGTRPDEELRRIRDVATRGAEIVRQLMIYAGKETEGLKQVDISRIVTDMLELLGLSASKRVVLQTHLGEGLPAVPANAAQVRQIVMNLVTNASEAVGDRDGVIRVTTRLVAVDPAQAISKGVEAGDYVQLEVSDTGDGMPPETQAKVFDPFFTTKSTGRGLGLAAVHGIVRNLHGAIHLASAPDKGTTIQILLPAAEAGAGTGTAARPDPRAGAAAGPSPAATVLVVEDEDTLRRPVVKLLRRKGFQILEAANGSVAIDLLRAGNGNIDAILLDMTIPGASSQEVLAGAERLQPNSKVILTSAYGEELVRTTLRSPLVRGFIRKPFRLDDLLQSIQDVLAS